MAQIAKTASVDNTVQLGENVTIGPGCVICPGVVIGDRCELKANVYICSGVELGCNNRLFANCIMGEEPQSLGCVAPDTKLIIGDNNVIRENVALNRGTPEGGGKTVVGDNNYFMIGSHLGHDCEVEDNTVIGNYSQIAGHNKIERNVWLSAFMGTHQFVTIGRYTFTSGRSGSPHDVPPYMRASGTSPCTVRGINQVGLERAGFSPKSIADLKKAYRCLYRRRNGKTIAQAIVELEAQGDLDEHVRYLLEFLKRAAQHSQGRYLELFRH